MLKGETDWKIIAIDVNDPLAPQLNGEIMIHELLLTYYLYT